MHCINYLSSIDGYYTDYRTVIILHLIGNIGTVFFDRFRINMDDDLMIVRNILHTNMLFCLIIVQMLYLFGIDQTKYKVIFYF